MTGAALPDPPRVVLICASTLQTPGCLVLRFRRSFKIFSQLCWQLCCLWPVTCPSCCKKIRDTKHQESSRISLPSLKDAVLRAQATLDVLHRWLPLVRRSHSPPSAHLLLCRLRPRIQNTQQHPVHAPLRLPTRSRHLRHLRGVDGVDWQGHPRGRDARRSCEDSNPILRAGEPQGVAPQVWLGRL